MDDAFSPRDKVESALSGVWTLWVMESALSSMPFVLDTVLRTSLRMKNTWMPRNTRSRVRTIITVSKTNCTKSIILLSYLKNACFVNTDLFFNDYLALEYCFFAEAVFGFDSYSVFSGEKCQCFGEFTVGTY